MRFTDKLNKIEGKTYTVEEEIIVTNGKYEGFLGHDNININTLVIYTEKGLKGDKVTNYSLSVKEDATWKTFIELYHPTNVYATYETSGDIVEAEDINILQDSILELYEKIKNLSGGADFTKDIQDLRNKDIELEQSINAKIDELIGSSPVYLDTLKELADAINNDPKFATNMKNELLAKADTTYVATELEKKSDVHTHPYKSIDYVPSWNEITDKPIISNSDVNKAYVDEKLALKSDVHTHPYKSDTYVPSWSEVTGKPTNATQSNNGFMSSLDKIKLDSIQNNANNYIHPTTHSASMILFSDGKTFQEKLNDGTLKGEKGDKGLTGATGTNGKDGLTTSVTVNGTKYSHSNGNITLPSYPTRISQLENDIGLGGLPSKFTWSMLRGD